MSYSTNDDLLIEMSNSDLARLTGDANGVTINNDRIDYARSTADNLIDSYLYGRYQLPLPTIPDPIIKQISIDLTLSILHEIAYRTALVPQTILQRKADALAKLKDIQLGNIILNNAIATLGAPPTIISNKTEDDMIFNDATLNEFFRIINRRRNEEYIRVY